MNDILTVSDARQALFGKEGEGAFLPGGTLCPCCNQHVSAKTQSGVKRVRTLRFNQLHRTVLDAIKRSPNGLTDEQITKVAKLSPNTERPRRIELAKMRLVFNSQKRRKVSSGCWATVWIDKNRYVVTD